MAFFKRNKTKDRKSEALRAFEAEAMPQMPTLYASALRLTRSPSDAEDLVQDTMLKAFRFHESFEAGTNIRAWLLRIQTNTFINRYRRRTRERTVLEGSESQPVGEGVMSRATLEALSRPEDLAQRSLLSEEIQRALDGLPEEHRAIILLADVEGLAYKEIAEILGCPIGTVMSRLHRARKAMQGSLHNQAVALGLVAPSAAEEEPEPLSLDAYRRKKEVAQ